MSVNSSEGTRFGLSGNALKLIAIIAMTVDHLAWMGIETYSQAETPLLIFLHVIGRLTAPIMLFFVADGYSHTRNFRKYLPAELQPPRFQPLLPDRIHSHGRSFRHGRGVDKVLTLIIMPFIELLLYSHDNSFLWRFC